MVASSETSRTIKIKVDDREVKQFYREFSNRDITVRVSLDKNSQRNMEKDLSFSVTKGVRDGSVKGSRELESQMKISSQKVKKDISYSLSQGIEEAGRKGSASFSKNMKKETLSLNSTLDGFSKNLTSSVSKPMLMMNSFVSALGKNLQGMLISTLVSSVGSLVNYLITANKEAAKLRKNLSQELSLPKVGSVKESLNLSLSVDSKMAEERLKGLISASPYFDDMKGSTANFLEVLNYLIEDDKKKLIN